MTKEKEPKLPPVEYVIAIFGSGAEVTRSLEDHGVTLHRATISHWKARGHIPQRHWPALLKAAKSKGYGREITPETLLKGGRR